jgi:RNA polymerase sigma-70 factor (ECF subfamily)
MAEQQAGIERWIVAARGGSPEALGQLFEACRGFLHLIAQRELDHQLRAKGSASDLVQETFVEAQRDFRAFRGECEDELLAWLRRLLLNNVRDFSRRYQGSGKRELDREVSLDALDAAGGLGLLLNSDSASPSEKAIRHEKADIVHQALARLPEDYRRILLLRYQAGRSFEEIGTLMDRSANAARKLWLRAIDRMEQELEQVP